MRRLILEYVCSRDRLPLLTSLHALHTFICICITIFDMPKPFAHCLLVCLFWHRLSATCNHYIIIGIVAIISAFRIQAAHENKYAVSLVAVGRYHRTAVTPQSN